MTEAALRHETTLRLYWTARFGIGLLVLFSSGMGVPGSIAEWIAGTGPGGWFTVDFLCGLWGFWIALGAVRPLAALATATARLRREWGGALHEEFERASIPRRVYTLLVSVAEADAPLSAAERETVRRFLLDRFIEPIDAADLRAWETGPPETKSRRALASRIAPSLAAAERDSLFCWCCLVCFTDGRFHDVESDALREVAIGLRIRADRARMLFHLARAQHLRTTERANAGAWTNGHRNGRGAGGARGAGAAGGPRADVAFAPADVRARAFATLGLALDASPDAIRRRHRELVRRFHPDAQRRLGPRAEHEASERFREIQRAYELLTD